MDECEFCKKRFSSFQALQLHIKTARKCLINRENVETRECEYCLKEFLGEASLQKHYTTCRFKERISELVDENRTLKTRVSVLQRELLFFKRAKKKDETSKKKNLLDVQNFEEEFMALLYTTETVIILSGIKKVVKDILRRSEHSGKKLWFASKKLKKIFYLEEGVLFSEKEGKEGKISSVATSCMNSPTIIIIAPS